MSLLDRARRRALDESADDELATWRQAYRTGLDTGSTDCPSEEELAALVVGELDVPAWQASAARLTDHAISCRRCADVVRTLLDLHDETAALSSAAGVRATGRHRRRRAARFWGWAAAAVLVIAVGTGLLERRASERHRPIVRGGLASSAAIVPGHGARLAEAPQTLAWTRLDEDAATTYQVTLYDVEAVPWWESPPTAATSIELPDAVRARLTAGTHYWRVRTDGEGGPRSSPLYRFDVAQ